MLLGVVDNVSS